MDCGWRTLVVDSASDLTLKDGCINVNKEPTVRVPISQLKNVVVTSPLGTITAALLNELCSRHVAIILCDEVRTPCCEVVSCENHTNAAGRIEEQACWQKERKQYAWKKIVEKKILSQIKLIMASGNDAPERMYEYMDTVENNDASMREAQAARLYFSVIFGRQFRRHAIDRTNAALDYGYAILRSSLDRIITAYGYITPLGINHQSANNRFNLSCDLMEPFRPFVDRIVLEGVGRDLDREYKLRLIAVLQERCRYRGLNMTVENAMELFFQDVIEYMASGVWSTGELDFV